MLRNAGLPVGMSDTEVSGGWHRHVVWGEADGREYLTANGRMMAMVDGEWRLRRNKLSGGQPAPFTLDPDYLVTVLKRMPSAARGVVHVEVGKLRGKAMTLLTIKLEDEVALEFAASGAAPDVGGAFSSMMIMGGIAGMEPPRPELETYLVFYVDAASGELARIAIRTYSTDAMMGNIQIAGGFVGEEEEEEEGEQGELTDDGKPAEVKWKRGLPRVKPAKDQSVMTYRVDFRDLGQAQAPELDEPSRRLRQRHPHVGCAQQRHLGATRKQFGHGRLEGLEVWRGAVPPQARLVLVALEDEEGGGIGGAHAGHRRQPEQLPRLCEVLLPALPLKMHQAKVELRPSVPLRRCQPVEPPRLAEVLRPATP